MKHRARIIAALVAGLFLLAIPMASAQSATAPSSINASQRYGLCLSLSPSLTICY